MSTAFDVFEVWNLHFTVPAVNAQCMLTFGPIGLVVIVVREDGNAICAGRPIVGRPGFSALGFYTLLCSSLIPIDPFTIGVRDETALRIRPPIRAFPFPAGILLAYAILVVCFCSDIAFRVGRFPRRRRLVALILHDLLDRIHRGGRVGCTTGGTSEDPGTRDEIPVPISCKHAKHTICIALVRVCGE